MKTAIVTGATRGIGRAVALMLADLGYSLFLAGREESGLNETARLSEEKLKKHGISPATEIYTGDLGHAGAAEKLFSEFEKSFNRLDLLVNNAGTVSPGRIGEYSEADWENVMNLNARTPFFLMQKSVPLLAAAEPGYIINIGSIVAKKGYANQALYSASKHALLGATKAVARDLQDTDIRIHAVHPGGVDTDLIRSVRPDINTDEMITADEIAESVKFLLTMKGNAFIDEISLRRKNKIPWD